MAVTIGDETTDKPKRKRSTRPTGYIVARKLNQGEPGYEDCLAVLGSFDDLKSAMRALQNGDIIGEGLMLLAVRRVFKSVTVVQKPRTIIE